MANPVPDRGEEPSRKPTSPDWSKMVGTCGHEDPLAYFAGTACMKCAKKNHKKAMGK
jgi:hypothetical protein